MLLNTYYAWTLGLRSPPAITLYSTPGVRAVARAVARRHERLDRRLYLWQVGRFMTDQQIRDRLLPEFYDRFRAARPAFWALNDDLLRTVFSRRRDINRMATFPRPVRIIFGANDPYLNPRVARWFHRSFPHSDLHLIPDARHYVQIDSPHEVAQLILEAPRHEAATTA